MGGPSSMTAGHRGIDAWALLPLMETFRSVSYTVILNFYAISAGTLSLPSHTLLLPHQCFRETCPVMVTFTGSHISEAPFREPELKYSLNVKFTGKNIQTPSVSGPYETVPILPGPDSLSLRSGVCCDE
ncbi:hypothetical protein HJG60_012275 [Phyllostomus discolor]|uniref:Uncharacterized protein n=1 Tax=Phyllostomus discolor TaxID=89673 RepID=A0A834DRN4_9CHIR|nr:hypothetical protein HJG60_012275 [Phyllostomus discolor]